MQKTVNVAGLRLLLRKAYWQGHPVARIGEPGHGACSHRSPVRMFVPANNVVYAECLPSFRESGVLASVSRGGL